VRFLLDGATLGAEDTLAPYTLTWNTMTANGPHIFAAVAHDEAGHETTTSAAVRVSTKYDVS
jgi:hypothetical protein